MNQHLLGTGVGLAGCACILYGLATASLPQRVSNDAGAYATTAGTQRSDGATAFAYRGQIADDRSGHVNRNSFPVGGADASLPVTYGRQRGPNQRTANVAGWFSRANAQGRRGVGETVRLDRIVIRPGQSMAFTGRGPSGEVITLKSGSRVLGRATAAANGVWRVDVPEVFGPGDYEVTAVSEGRATDVAKVSPDVRISIPRAFQSGDRSIVAYERDVGVPTRRPEVDNRDADRRRAEEIAQAGNQEFDRWQERQTVERQTDRPAAPLVPAVRPLPLERRPEVSEDQGLLGWLERAARGYQEQVVEKLATPEVSETGKERPAEEMASKQPDPLARETEPSKADQSPTVDYDDGAKDTDAVIAEARRERERSAQALARLRETLEREALEREAAERAERERLARLEAEAQAREAARLAEIERRSREAALLEQEIRARQARDARERADALRAAQRQAAQAQRDDSSDEVDGADTVVQRRTGPGQTADADDAREAERRQRRADAERLRQILEQRRLVQEAAEREAREAAERMQRERLRRVEERANEIAQLYDVVRAEAQRRAEADARAQEAAEQAQILAQERAEADRLAAEQAEAQRLADERARVERQRAQDAARQAAERLALEQAETERLRAERLQAEREAAARAAAEKLAADRLAADRARVERQEAQRREAERLEAARLEVERLAKAQAEAEAAARARELAARRAEQRAAEQRAEELRLLELTEQRARNQRLARVLERSNTVAELSDRARADRDLAERALREAAAGEAITQRSADEVITLPERNTTISTVDDREGRFAEPQRTSVKRRGSVASWRSDPNRKCRDEAGVELISLPGVYTVAFGDTLWDISERHYGAGHRYWRIYRKNRRKIRNPHWIYPCQRFVLPRDTENSRHF
ncbi:MAG: LysM peptidoglycan-binding domain-containing protein [Pseudomonadota bacterium]